MSKNPKKNKKSLSRLTYNLIITLLFLIGILVLLYPTFSNMWNQHVNSSLISDYEKIISDISEDEYDDILKKAQEYNEQHKINVFHDVFQDEEYILKYPYNTLLNPNGNNIMGYIEIPKINQKLYIGHGTGTTTLEKGVGHVEGTSLPIGGPSTHCVLAGHRGLPNAKIFTDLDEVALGDKFFIYVLNEALAYEIDQIVIVEPDDAEKLAIEDGQDYVTLLTCTPYGINTQRMFVRGHRIPYVAEDVKIEASHQKVAKRDLPIYLMALGVSILFIIVIIMGIIKRKKEKKNV